MTKAQDQWDKEHTVRMNFKFNKKTDADVLAYLAKQKSKQGRVKELIREDIKKEEGK